MFVNKIEIYGLILKVDIISGMDKYKKLFNAERNSFVSAFSEDSDITVRHIKYTDEQLADKPDFIRRNRVMGDATSLSHSTVFGAVTFDMNDRSVHGFLAFKKSTCDSDPANDTNCFPTKFVKDKEDNPLDLFDVTFAGKNEFLEFMTADTSDQDAFCLVL